IFQGSSTQPSFVSSSNVATALRHALGTISISNNSWGPVGTGDISVLPAQVATALQTGAETGRTGKGVVYVWAAGNGGAGVPGAGGFLGSPDYVNYDPYASSKYVIAVGAVDHAGVHSVYSERGASLLVSGYSSPAAIMSLDLRDDDGVNMNPPTNSNVDPDQERYNGLLLNRNYTRTIANDTSTAAAGVSGVVALMLEANPNLTYRDVMDILVRTSRRTDPGDAEWTQNGAGLWVNYKYGFGVVDAQAAVTAALTHVNRASQVNDNTSLVPVNTLIPDFSSSGVSATVDSTSALALEHVELVLNASHNSRADLEVTLVSPNGTRAVMAESRVLQNGSGSNYTNYTFTTPRFWGEESIGTWTVEVKDLQNGISGTFNSFQLKFYGTELPLALSVTPRSINENAGLNAATGFVSRPASADLSVPLVVDLTSSDTTEATVPATVTILPGRRSATFQVDAVDDTLLDGLQTARITASVGSYSTRVNLDVLDHEDLTITIDPVAFSEDDGPNAATLTITRSNTNVNPPDKIVAVNNELRRYDDAGALVSTDTIPWPAGARPVDQNAHDVVVMANGNIAVYNGTTTAFLSVFNIGTGVWSHISLAGLSTSAADGGTGGITTSGDYVFLTDMETNVGDLFGLVRVDVRNGTVNRFGTKSFGSRLFTDTLFDNSIYEISPVDGRLIKQIPMPVGSGGDAGFAFDGTFIWYIPGGSTTLYKVDPEASAIVDSFALNFDGAFGNATRNIQGLGWLNDKVYMSDTQNEEILVFDPSTRGITRTLLVGGTNGVWLGSGLTGNPENNSLFVTGQIPFTGNYEVYEISASSGQILRRFSGDVWDTGLAVVGSELYVGSQVGREIRVYSLQGAQLRTIVLPSTSFFFSTYGLGSDGIPGLVPTSFRYRDTNVGLDGNLYALDLNGVDVGVFDPTTLAVVRFFQLDAPVRAIAVAADGKIYGAEDSGDVIEFNTLGKFIRRASSTLGVLNDIDLNNAGTVLLSNTVGEFAVTDRTLATFAAFSSTASNAFISFGESAVFSTADLVVTITNPDPTEVSVPRTFIIPAGQQSVTVPLGAVDDNIRDGAQQVIISVSSQGYFGSSKTIVVLDAEGIRVDVIADSISEAAGDGATKVRVSRTDVDGPYTTPMTQEFRNPATYDITDNGRIYVPIVVTSQVSRIVDLDVAVNFQHAHPGDLDVFLISPRGTRVELFTDLLTNGNRLTGTIFDDQANESILQAAEPYTGRFMPEGALSKFGAESPAGTWLLEVTDDNTSDIGKLLGWSIMMNTQGLAPATVLLETSRVDKAGFQTSVQKTVVIPANQSEILVDLDAVDNNILDGDATVTIEAKGVDVADFGLDGDTVIVTDKETLTLTVNKSVVTEAGGIGAVTGTLTRLNSNISLPYTVTLSSSNTNKLTVQASVTIPANQASVTFPINAIDNGITDGDVMVTITGTAPEYGNPVAVVIDVLDQEPVLRLTTTTTTVAENGGSFSVTVTRVDQTDLSAAMIVNLTAGPGLSVPATVTIPSGLDSVTFSVGIIDNAILSGTRSSNIQATGSLITAGDLGITITDYETLTITVDKSSFLENAGVKAAIGTVRRSNTGNLAQALVVALSSSDETELKVPATVTIPAGQASATFFIEAVNDPNLDGTQNVTITATSAGYVNGTVGVAVLDHEPPVLSGPTATTPKSKPTITWNALSGALRYDVWITNLTTNVAQIVRNINVPTNSFVPPENLGIGRYRVWVRAIDNLEVPGYWSVGRDFFINTPATITSPSPNTIIAGSSFPTITWSAIPDAVKYEVWVNSLTTGQIRVINRSGATALSTTSYVSTENLPSGTYKIWVRGLNSKNEAGLWSLPTTHTVLAPPVITQPVGGGTFDTTPTFGWNAVTGATSYDLYVADLKTNVVVLRNQFVTTSSFTATKDIPSGEYRMWVRAQSGNSFSAWSAPSTFSIGLPPKITSAKTVGTPAKPQFSWTTILGTEHYELWVNNAANVRVIYQPNLTTTTFTNSTTLPAGTYRVWVRAVSTMGEITAWSAPVNLVIASLDSPKGLMESAQTTVLASLIFNDEPLTPDGSPIETLLASTTEAGAPVKTDVMPDLAVPAASDVTSMIPVEPAPAAVSEYDAVMSEWQSADWWAGTSETQDRKELHSTAALAASLGLVVRQGQRSDDRRKRRW
ncbi:MAG: proprotein convertase P-domain-containing protein, partial [Fuerstia sp.]|nr:proprotein convertase P-domain-containing protein [Fuerstiella sp.]